MNLKIPRKFDLGSWDILLTFYGQSIAYNVWHIHQTLSKMVANESPGPKHIENLFLDEICLDRNQ